MKFSIITPTYQRPEKLKRAIDSVLAQGYTNWELIIINDNPGDDTKSIINEKNDARIILLENPTNSGVNFSRNRGLDTVSKDSAYILFLDDDDYLAPNALSDLFFILDSTPHSWLVSARGFTPQLPSTKAPHNGVFSYAWDYLITKKISGDATHAIAARYITGQVAFVRFPTQIKQAEEWLFYFELSMYTNLYYQNIITTLTDGYSDTGLNNRVRGTKEQLKNLITLAEEGISRGLIRSPQFFLYLCLRFVRAFIKK